MSGTITVLDGTRKSVERPSGSRLRTWLHCCELEPTLEIGRLSGRAPVGEFGDATKPDGTSLRKKPWKQDPFAAWFTNQRRGRDSNNKEILGQNGGIEQGWHGIRHSFDQNRF